MSETRPRLVAIKPPVDEPEPADDSRGATRTAFWVLVALVSGCALIAAFQTQRVGQLQGEVTALTDELWTARDQLDAYQGRLVEIRGAVSDLRSQVGELDELVARDPLADPSGQP